MAYGMVNAPGGAWGSAGGIGRTGANWHLGTGITGTQAEAKAFPESGLESAAEGACYLNTDTGNLYRCAQGGDAATATWSYLMCLRGPEGSASVQTGTQEPSDSGLQEGTIYLVYEAAAAAAMLEEEPAVERAAAVRPAGAMLASVAAAAEMAGAVWHAGTGVTGTNGSGSVFPDSGVESARVGDFYLNTDTGNLYRCAQGGEASAAVWAYAMCLQGPKGNANVQASTQELTPGESPLEDGRVYLVYEEGDA